MMSPMAGASKVGSIAPTPNAKGSATSKAEEQVQSPNIKGGATNRNNEAEKS